MRGWYKSKFGEEWLNKWLDAVADAEAELAPDNIRVNAVCPGWVDTEFNVASISNLGAPQGQKAVIEKNVPMARQALAGEVAPMFVYPASDEAS